MCSKRFSRPAVRFLVPPILLIVGITFGLAASMPKSWAQGRENISSTMDGINVTPSRPWTVKEMKAATPLPAPEISQPGSSTYDPAQGPTGPAGFAPRVLPMGTKTNMRTGKSLPAPAKAPDYLLFEVKEYKAFPYITIGKLFFRLPGDGKDHWCTAASIGNQAIWTAGHCVHLGNNSPDGWAYDGVFVPAYNDANSTLTSHCTSAACQPFGQWSVKDFWTRQTWYEWGRWLGLRLGIRRDMGGAILNLNENGQKISEVVGNLGFAWNQPREQTWSFFGYPGDPSPPFSPYASKAFICYGDYGYSVAIGLPSPGPEMSAMGCNMGHGSSGGPWIKDFGSGDYLGGQMSFLRPTSEALSPYFDDEANSLRICLVDGNC